MQPNEAINLLKAISMACDGTCAITDKQGNPILTHDINEEQPCELEVGLAQIAKVAGSTAKVQVDLTQSVEGSVSWAIPIGEYVIVANNSTRIKREQNLLYALNENLPAIARIIGGEVTLFDAAGTRLNNVDFEGIPIYNSIGNYSLNGHNTMQSQKLTIIKSNIYENGIAVRIPLNNRFGIGFNNSRYVYNRRKIEAASDTESYLKYSFSDIIGKSQPILEAKQFCKAVNKSSSILILGETGTGKEMFAQAIHNESQRKNKPFIAVNCGALPASIIESYLFGYVGGSFTGARREGSEGVFEHANGGTIFLDEISEMPLDLQVRLLRVLQEKEVVRVGGFKPIKLDIKIIASSNKDLQTAVANGEFRQDLFYRINVVEITIPPLRDRKNDIPLLADHFIKIFNKEFEKFIIRSSDEFLSALLQYDWPGNIRELKACIESAVCCADIADRELDNRHLPAKLTKTPTPFYGNQESINLKQQIQFAEIAAITRALRETGNQKIEAAKLLGINPCTLWRKMKDYALA